MPGGRDRGGDPDNDLTREGIMRRMMGAAQHWLNGGTITPEQQERYNAGADARDSRRRSKMTWDD
jgi:hypothetical protein